MKLSKQHEIFNEYCQGKIMNDDEIIKIQFNDFGDDDLYEETFHIVSGANIRGVDSYVLYNVEDDDAHLVYVDADKFDNMKVKLLSEPHNKDELMANEIWFSTPMIDICAYFSRMEFTWISKYFKDLTDKYWDDIGMDSLIDD